MNIPEQYEKYINKKTGQEYAVITFATNATNAQNGQQMVIYKDNEHKLYVREVNEFNEKFTKK